MGNGDLSKSFYPDSPLPIPPTEDGLTNIASKRPSATSAFTFLNSNSSTAMAPEHKPETIARWYYKCAACWVPRNLFKLEAEARRGSKLARCFLARMHVYDATFIKKDIPKAIMLMDGLLPWLQRESALIDSPYHLYAMFLLATCYAKGIGIEQNTSIAYQLYSESALQGYDAAQNALAKCYKQGLGIDLDLHQAIKWFEMAAEQGHAEAQYNLGYLYEHGWSPPTVSQESVPLPPSTNAPNAVGYVLLPNQEKALYYYQLSGSQGNAHALYSLGWYLRHGSGGVGPRNFAESLRLFLIAAEKGLADAQYIVGLSYDVGDTTDQNDHDLATTTANNNTNNDSSDIEFSDRNSMWQQRRLTAVEMTPTRPVMDKKLLTTPNNKMPIKGTILSFSPMPSEYEATDNNSINNSNNNSDNNADHEGISRKSENMLQASVFSPSEKRRYLAPESPANFQQIVIDLSPVPQTVLRDLLHTSHPEVHSQAHVHTGHTSTAHHSHHTSENSKSNINNNDNNVLFPFPPAETTTPLLYSASNKHHHQHQNRHVSQTKDVLICMSPNPQYQHVHQPFRFRINAQEAFKWYLLAAEQGHAGAQCNVGYAFMTGEGLPEYYYDNFGETADKSIQNVSNNNGKIVIESLLSTLSPARFTHTISSDNASMLYRVWRETQAVQWYMASATQGHEEGQYNLALCHLHGDGSLPRDLQQAMKLFRASATQGHHMQAQYELAKCYRYLAERQHLYKQAQWTLLHHNTITINNNGINNGANNSTNNTSNNRIFSKKLISLSVIEGVSVSGVDCATEVFKACVSAADQGCVSAMFMLAECYEYGFGAKKSATEARRWYEQTLAHDCCTAIMSNDKHNTQTTSKSHNNQSSNHNVTTNEDSEEGEHRGAEEEGSETEEGVMLALFRMGYACLPAIHHHNPNIIISNNDNNSNNNITNNSNNNNKNSNGIRMQMLLCSLPKAMQCLLKAAHCGHLLAQAFIAQQLEMEILKPLYPLSLYHNVSFTINMAHMVSNTMVQHSLKSQIATLWAYYENVAMSILQKLVQRLYLCYLYHRDNNINKTNHNSNIDNNADTYNENNKSNENVNFQSPADIWAKISAMLFFNLLTTNAYTNVDISLLSVEFIRYLNKDFPNSNETSNGNSQEDTSFSCNVGIDTDEYRTNSNTNTAFEETLLWWFAEDVELMNWSQTLMVQACYFVARQCERYLLSVDNAINSNNDEREEADDILFEHVELLFQSHSFSSYATNLDSNNNNNMDYNSGEKAHQWSMVLMLYYFAAIYGNHRAAMARLAALLLSDAEYWANTEEENGESIALPWLGMLSMVVYNNNIDNNSSNMNYYQISLMQMVSNLVHQPSVHEEGNNSGKNTSDTSLTRWYIRDFLRYKGMHLWHTLATETSSSNNNVPIDYTTKIAQYRLALTFEMLANEYASVVSALAEDSQDMSQAKHELYLQYFNLSPSAVHIMSSFYQPFQFVSTATKEKHMSPAHSPSRVSPNGSMLPRIPESPVSPNATFLFPSVGTNHNNSGHNVHNLALLKRRCEQYQHLCQEQAILYFLQAAGGNSTDNNNNTDIISGYYLAQYSLAWSCEQHFAACLYGVSETRQETFAKYWYEQVVLSRLSPLLHEVKRLYNRNETDANNTNSNIHIVDERRKQEQQDTINNYTVVNVSHNNTYVDKDNYKTAVSNNMAAWQLENQGELWLWDVYPERFHLSAVAGVWQGRQDTVSDACFALAQGYQLAHGVDEKDIVKAMHWYEQAISVADVAWVCPQGNNIANSEENVANSEEKEVFGEAEEEIVGHADALYQLACIYLYGDSGSQVTIDYKTAKLLLQRSAKLGHEEAKSLLEMSSSG